MDKKFQTGLLVKVIITTITSLIVSFYGFSATRTTLNPELRLAFREKIEKAKKAQIAKDLLEKEVERVINQAQKKRDGTTAPPNTRQGSTAGGGGGGDDNIGADDIVVIKTPEQEFEEAQLELKAKQKEVEDVKEKIGKAFDKVQKKPKRKSESQAYTIAKDRPKREKAGVPPERYGYDVYSQDEEKICGIEGEALMMGFLFFLILSLVIFITELSVDLAMRRKPQWTSYFIRGILIAGFTSFTFVALSLTERQITWGYLLVFVLFCTLIPVILQFSADIVIEALSEKNK